MEYREIKMNVPKEASELGEALGEILKVVSQSIVDGWNTAEDVPVIVTTTLMQLVKAVEGFNKLPEEFKDDPVVASLGILNPALLGIKEMIKLKK